MDTPGHFDFSRPDVALILDEARQALEIGQPQVCLDVLSWLETSLDEMDESVLAEAIGLAAAAVQMELTAR